MKRRMKKERFKKLNLHIFLLKENKTYEKHLKNLHFGYVS